MAAFRIEPTPRSSVLRVLSGPAEQRAVAIITPEDDGTVCLFPVDFDGPPAPLTGFSQPFPDVEAVAVFLGIETEWGDAA